ncbi:hypothetical protein BDE36_1284 [Arcticibacter tournemirensis]|uniref:Uncharacterized protein n=1 Tax=Arcticibacter tournemirensis TaxID=699437 RepID=A0A5M9GT07_9SPHI|nr:hypothetical protein [Arcticibacter tournemirensis]KAA8476861.1 hypothetical protein F1649_19495 [Arcticibacter tournemirensis]TQM49567.1 hypothetical protein BDE36_1284 [Arcticibacter tournemirensis]
MITSFLNAGSIRERVPLSMLLSRLGYQPAKSSGDEQLYLNVLRNAETSPTFAINTQLGVWFDRLTKKSGDLVDFGLAYWPGLSSDQVLEKISQLCACSQGAPAGDTSHRAGRKRRAIKIPYYHIAETRPLGCNPEITAYLQSQGIWEISIGQLKEVYYYVVDEKQRRKDFFAAGWQNENGGWEVRSRNFAGCLGRKGMTFIPGDENRLALFRDYISYLSWKYANRASTDSILVMNAPEFLPAAKSRAAKFAEVADFFGQQHPEEHPFSAI